MRTVRIVTFAAFGILSLGAAVVTVETRQARQRASPHESVSATVDGAELTITYGRPYMRGRTIFGRLVPWDRVWCPGADEATTLDSTRPLRLGGLSVPAGPHTIWILPTPETWTLVVSKEPSGFHTNYNSSADLGRIEMMKRTVTDPVEQLTFAIVKNPAAAGAETPAGSGGLITMTWETTEVSVPFTVE
jgi:hypothetical protein